MKKITLCIMLLLAVIMLSGTVLAAEDVVEVATYGDLVEAISGDKNIVLTDTIEIEEAGNIVIDGNGKTITTSTVEKMFKISATDSSKLNVTFENITLESNVVAGRCIQTSSENIVLNINNSTLKTTKGAYDQVLTIGTTNGSTPIEVNITSSEIKAGSHYAIIAFSPVNLTIENSIVTGYGAIYMKDNTTGSKINIDKMSGIRGINKSSGYSDNFGAIVLEDSGITIDVKGMSFVGTEEQGTAYEFALMDKVGNNTITVSEAVIDVPRVSMYYTDTTKVTLADGTEICDPSIASNIDMFKNLLPEGARYKLLGDNFYRVYEKNSITVENPDKGGKIEIVPSSAYAEDIVEIKVTVEEGYKLDRIGYSTSGLGGAIEGEELLGEKITFEVPYGKVSMTPVFVKLEQEAEVPEEVENAEKVEEMLLKELAENEEFAELVKNNNVTVKLDFDKVEEKDIPAEDKKEIEEAASGKSEGIKIAKFIDITINVKKDGTVVDNLETVKEAITFKVKIPTDLPKLEEGYTRTYYIVRNHDGKIEFLDTKVSGEELEFSSNLFSTYAIAYSDEKIVETPSEEKPSGEAPGASSEGTEAGKGESSAEEKDETPNMGSIDTVLYASAIVAIISLAGIVMVKKYTK